MERNILSGCSCLVITIGYVIFILFTGFSELFGLVSATPWASPRYGIIYVPWRFALPILRHVLHICCIFGTCFNMPSLYVADRGSRYAPLFLFPRTFSSRAVTGVVQRLSAASSFWAHAMTLGDMYTSFLFDYHHDHFRW
jgi:hypothetical protein